MTKQELQKVLRVLVRIKEPDAYVGEVISIINRNIEVFNQRKGQRRGNHYSKRDV